MREREKGTLEQLLVTPIDPLGLMLGKLGPYLFVGLGEMALILFAMRFGFGVPIRGSLVFLFGMALIYLFALLSLGLFVSTRAKTQAEAQQMAQMFLLPSIFLSGYIFPFEGLPLVLQDDRRDPAGDAHGRDHARRGAARRRTARADAARARAHADLDGARRFVRPQFPESGRLRFKRGWKASSASI